MQVILIDASKRTVELIEVATQLEAVQALLGGAYLEFAYQWPTADVLYVREDEGDETGDGFVFAPPLIRRWFAGNGIVVGRESGDDDSAAWAGNDPPHITADELRRLVTFLRAAR